MTAFASYLLRLACLLLVTPLFASSTIYDGVIIEVEPGKGREVYFEDGKKKHRTRDVLRLKIRSLCSPYSSETVHSWILNHRDGTYKTNNRLLTDFSSFFVDEVPVSLDDMMQVIKPGMRVATFENRAPWYFLRVETRNPNSQIGHLVAIGDGSAVIARRQHQYKEGREPMPGKGSRRVEEDGKTYFDDVHYPPLRNNVIAPPDTEIIDADGRKQNLNQLSTFKNKLVFYQAERKQQRVELIPAGYGNWDLVTQNQNFLGERKQMEYSALSVNTAAAFRQVDMNTRPLHKVPIEGEKIQRTQVIDSYLLAGWPKVVPRGPMALPMYSGNWNIIDGFYALDNDAFWHLALTPGRHLVSTTRRGRMKADAWMYSSELPAVWGAITAIDGNTITLEAPVIEGAGVSGVQTITIDDNAEYVRLGQPTDKANALKVGALIKIFAPHPTRIYLGKE